MHFILGGKGFIGSAFVRYCQAKGIDHAVITRENYPAYVGRSCDVFVNANGNSSKVLAERDPMADFDASVRSVRQTLLDFRIGCYAHLSSCDVYQDCSSPLTSAEDRLDAPASLSKYGFHKRLAEQCVQHGAPNWLIFRLGGGVGPGLRKNAVFDILRGGPLWLDPESRLQFLPTDFIPEALAQAMAAARRNEVFNLCGDGVVSLREAIAWSGKPVAVNPGAPRVNYDVSVAKIKTIVRLPLTRESVRAYFQGAAR